jgi:HD-GYP domain-containing protein (c-di-GMP phosphodiesterase class II)
MLKPETEHPFTLLHPVRTLDNEVLLPAGTVLSGDTLDALVSSSDMSPHQTCSLLRHGSVKEDLFHLLGQPPYQVIFAGKDQISQILSLLDRVCLVAPVLQSLDYFKHYDAHTYSHILLVSALATRLAGDLVSDYQTQMQEPATAPCHDFGKICVPLPVLKKVDPLTRTERAMVEHHTAAGYVLLSY